MAEKRIGISKLNTKKRDAIIAIDKRITAVIVRTGGNVKEPKYFTEFKNEMIEFKNIVLNFIVEQKKFNDNQTKFNEKQMKFNESITKDIKEIKDDIKMLKSFHEEDIRNYKA